MRREHQTVIIEAGGEEYLQGVVLSQNGVELDDTLTVKLGLVDDGAAITSATYQDAAWVTAAGQERTAKSAATHTWAPGEFWIVAKVTDADGQDFFVPCVKVEVPATLTC